MLQEIEAKLGMKVRGFTWIGAFTKANRNHFVEFYGWDGEIYVRNEGIYTYPEYYKRLLEQGMCLYVNGMIIAKVGYSDHFNALHKVHLGHRNNKSLQSEEEGYPVVNPNEKAVFESAVNLYKMGLLSLEQFATRVKRYIKPEQQELVLAIITTPAA